MNKRKDVSENIHLISFKVINNDGVKHEAVFMRPEKIAELLSDKGSLGKFLEDLIKGMLV
jgi:hypothetical protein